MYILAILIALFSVASIIIGIIGLKAKNAENVNLCTKAVYGCIGAIDLTVIAGIILQSVIARF